MHKDEFGKLVVTLAAQAAVHANPTATLSVAGFNVLRNMSARRAEAKAQQAFDALVDSVAAAENYAGEDRHDRVVQLLEEADDNVADAVLEGFRSMLFAIEPAAVPYIARLTSRYVSARRGRDDFFRRVGAMLAEATAQNVAELTGLATALHESMPTVLGLESGFHFTLMVDAHPETLAHLPSGTPTCLLRLDGPEPGDDFAGPPLSIGTALLLEGLKLASAVERPGGHVRMWFWLNDTKPLRELVELLKA